LFANTPRFFQRIYKINREFIGERGRVFGTKITSDKHDKKYFDKVLGIANQIIQVH